MKYQYKDNQIIFDKIYSVKEIVFTKPVKSIEWAINPEIKNTNNIVIDGNKVLFMNVHVRYLFLGEDNKITSIVKGDGYTITEETKIDNVFRRNKGWAGADGIYSHVYKDTIHWYFSDTLVGDVNPITRKRKNMVMVNNTVGVSNTQKPFLIDFMVKKDQKNKYTSFYVPEKEGYYWLQDGVYKDGYLYISVIRVRDDKDKWFVVLGSEMIKVKVNADDTLDYNNYTRFDNPTYFEMNGETYTFGAAMLDDTTRTGYYYMFGYDNKLEKNLYMLRVKDFEKQDSYEYFTENGWSNNPTNFKVIGENVANEMRIIYDGKYILSYTKQCATETIEIASTNDLEKGFTNRIIIYQCKEAFYNDTLITYNAKLHQFPNDNDLYFTYNVNTTVIEDLVDADIYYPRWLRLEKESD